MIDLTGLNGLDSVKHTLSDGSEPGRSDGYGNVDALVSDSVKVETSVSCYGPLEHDYHNSLVYRTDDRSGSTAEHLLQLALLLVLDQLRHRHVPFGDDKVGFRQTLNTDLAGCVFSTNRENADGARIIQ